MRLPRRKVLKAAIGLGALGLAGSVIGVLRSRGYDAARPKLVGLEPWQFVVVEHLARRVCAADAPGVVTPDDADVAGFVDAYVAKMPRRMRRDLGRFLGVVEQVAPAFSGFASRFSRLAPSDQDRVLASLESSASDLLRGGFEGIKALLFMGYYRDARTWRVIGYDGPRVDAAPP
ncbi:MAG: gluconate 2-dehydrogenase subunit 3 family protein [Labilithrix sp.]|nr:gluconate 2-dehydrogenase subunit 3 family protein [Labilithrix sp.]